MLRFYQMCSENVLGFFLISILLSSHKYACGGHTWRGLGSPRRAVHFLTVGFLLVAYRVQSVTRTLTLRASAARCSSLHSVPAQARPCWWPPISQGREPRGHLIPTPRLLHSRHFLDVPGMNSLSGAILKTALLGGFLSLFSSFLKDFI